MNRIFRGSRPRTSKWAILVIWSALAASLVCLFYLPPEYSEPLTSKLLHHETHVSVTRHQLENFPIHFKEPDQNGGTVTRRLRVVMPADGASINMCKTIMSSIALGYPLPTLLNWEGDFNRPEWHFGGSHIAKLESVLAVIEELLQTSDDAHEDDLVLMVDAYDVWFQLPPSVLIERFHQLNREADERNRRLWENAVLTRDSNFPISYPRQSVVITSAKDCNPDSDSGSSPHYDLWPQSPMPDDLYGEETDTSTLALFDASRKFRRVRPRCVNSGLIMGRMGALRDVLRRCKEKADNVARAGRQLWSDQALVGEVIGDQEAWRLWAQELATTWNGTASDSWESTKHHHVRKIAHRAMSGERFEFGIGVDYNFTTIPPTCSSEDDAYFVEIDDRAKLRSLSEGAGVPGDVRVKGVPPELVNSLEFKEGPYKEIQWGSEPLYSDFFFGTTPVGIHHNAYANGLKPWRLANWWSRMWFYSLLRRLVTYSLSSRGQRPRTLLEISQSGTGTIKYEAPQEEQVTVFNPERQGSPASFETIDWDGVCQKGSKPWYEEIFGDGKGPLEV